MNQDFFALNVLFQFVKSIATVANRFSKEVDPTNEFFIVVIPEPFSRVSLFSVIPASL